MAGLVSYASSDDEGEERKKSRSFSHDASRAHDQNLSGNGIQSLQTNGKKSLSSLVGPVLGPTKPDGVEESLEPPQDEDTASSEPQSPYSANRAALRDLTLPTVPNYDIPPSPPGSPVSSTNAKFKHFLDLKKQGVHFNDKLAKSSALKNPSVMQQLLDFSDINEKGRYATTLPTELWNPAAFPEHVYKEGLSKSQHKVLKKREDDKAKGPREVEFVPAIAFGETSRNGTPRIGQKSAAERIMAGLDRGRSNSPQVQTTGKRKTRFD